MKYKFICLALLLALQLCVPASATAEDRTLKENAETIGESGQGECASAVPHGSTVESECTDWIEPQGGEYGIFQDGAFFGPQTLPVEAALFDVSEHPEYGAAEQRLYQEIEAALKDHLDRISITPFPVASKERLASIYFQVINDHPEFFYCQGGLNWSYTPTSIIAISPKYLYTAAETAAMTAEFNRRVSDALAQIDGITDDLEKILTLHDYLAVTCKYAQPIPTPPSPVYSAYGVLVNQEAVCQGYALAFKLLMNKINIPCVLVEGAKAMNHVWNAVQLNGKWYHVDVTWDDPIPNREGYSRHDYFLRSNAKMLTEGTGSGCHYGWNESVVSPWGGTEYDSGWIFNTAKTPLYRWNNHYYYIEAPYSNISHAYKADSLRAPGISVRENLLRDSSCGSVWHNNRLYYIPYTNDSTLNVMALDLDAEKTVRLGEFTRSGNEPVALRYENNGITVFRPNTEVLLGRSPLLPDWRKFMSFYRSYGLSADGKYLLFDRYAANVTGKALWIASYNSSGRMTFVGSALSLPVFAYDVYGSVDFQMVPFQSCGTPSDSIKAFLLDPMIFQRS